VKLKDAFDDLDRFRVQVRVVAPESPAEDHVARDEDTTRLVRLAGEFGLALDRRSRKLLESRAFSLACEIRRGEPLERMRRLVLPMLGWAVDESGQPKSELNAASLLFPLELGLHRMAVQARIGLAEDEGARDAGHRWLGALEALDGYLARQHCWGSLIIYYCAEGLRGADGAGLLYHTRDVLRGQLPAAALAVTDAARSLMRWRRDRRRELARSLTPVASPDFREVLWYGAKYYFTATQAACVRVMWEAWDKGAPEVSGERILEEADYEGKRMVDLFKGHPAWNTMIVAGHTKGSRRLQEPREWRRTRIASAPT
jgi:hypothetical protein